MIKKLLIQKLVACFLLLLFAFSMAPKKFLHDLVANHRDTKYSSLKLDNTNTLLSKAGYHCPLDHQIVESPFENILASADSVNPDFNSRENCSKRIEFLSFNNRIVSLRGPPASC